ncbi:NAD(+) synthase, partial [Faecalibacillus faecis]
MKDGYIRVASASIDTLIGNVKHNANEIKKVLKETREKKAQVVVFPELVLSGYTLEDLFLQNRLLNECLVQLEEIMKDTKGHQQIVVIGLPFHYQNNLYNVSAVLYDGSILGIVPKYHIPNYNEYYEGRRFTPCFEDNIEIELFGQIVLFGRKVVFACQNLPSFTLGVEICEDLWLPNAPSNELALNGATVICNTSASNELTAKKDYRRNLVSMQSAKLVSGYVYSNAGSGESTTDVVFSGHHLICENGTIVSESTGFDAEVIYGDLDVEKFVSERRKMTTYQSHHDYDYVYFDMDLIDIETNHYYDPHPFVPSNPKLRELRCKEVFEIQTRGLMQRLKATHIDKVVIGISGGLDSTLALLVCVMAFDKLGYDKKNIYAITMPCFGTTSRTKNNALGLMEELGVTSQTINIADVVRMQFKNIDQDENVHDVTYENVQARERTEILMNKANQIGGLVIGTGDLSEVALGWSTYN